MSIYARLLAKEYVPNQTDYECRHAAYTDHIAILAVFDHDWEQHLLVKQCSTGTVARFLGMDKWEYALYYVSGNDNIIHLRTFFDAERTPFVEAAAMVECWQRTGHYGGTTNAVESDAFNE